MGTGGTTGSGGASSSGGATSTGGTGGTFSFSSCSVNGFSFTNDWACRPVNVANVGWQWCMNPANLACSSTATSNYYDGTSTTLDKSMNVTVNGYCQSLSITGQFDGSYGLWVCANGDASCWAQYPVAPYYYASSNKQWVVQSPNGFGCRGFRNSDGTYAPATGSGNFTSR